MSEKTEPVGKRVERVSKGGGMDSRRFMELLMLDTLMDWSAGKGIVTLTDGKNTCQCVFNTIPNEQPKSKP